MKSFVALTLTETFKEKMIYLILCFLFSTVSFAHDDHDWRQDYEAYLLVNYQIPFAQKSFNSKSLDILNGRIDMDAFARDLAIFSGVRPVPGTSEVINERKSNLKLDLARKFLKEEYEKLGYEVSFHPFGAGTNFIAEKKGNKTPQKVLILSSHIDSVGNAGANDNGTGTIGLLAVARELAKKEYASTVRILGFDREERGLLGSDAYVATIQNKKDIIGDINFEMMGYHSRNDGAFHVIDCDRTIFGTPVSKVGSDVLSKAMKESIRSLNLSLSVVPTCTNRSDHASFWRHKIPAIVISENFFGGDADPCYHARCDIFDDRLNMPYMANILEATLKTTENFIR